MMMFSTAAILLLLIARGCHHSYDGPRPGGSFFVDAAAAAAAAPPSVRGSNDDRLRARGLSDYSPASASALGGRMLLLQNGADDREEEEEGLSAKNVTTASVAGRRSRSRLLAAKDLVFVGNNGSPSNAFPLGACEGDCDNDDECAGTLRCYQRSTFEEVPGCIGPGLEKNDYCCDVPPNTLFHPSTRPRMLCEGDCDTDDECGPNLVCFQRRGYDPVPTCIGPGRMGADYCILDGTAGPTVKSTNGPTNAPTDGPTYAPTPRPTSSPTTTIPTGSPSPRPSVHPTSAPTNGPVTSSPTKSPEGSPVTDNPTNAQTDGPVTGSPTKSPSASPITRSPTKSPTFTTGQPTKAPMSVSTNLPTNTPTRASISPIPLATVGNNGSPSNAFPLGACQGDCDGDSDCQPGLRCYKRRDTEEVFGCIGPGVSKDDYCFDRPYNYLFHPTTPVPHGLCEGDCDNDDECDPGMICFLRRDYDPVPTCIGPGRQGADYCILDGTAGPTAAPTPQPTTEALPTEAPIAKPTVGPTNDPTVHPTNNPTEPHPTSSPTTSPTLSPLDVGNGLVCPPVGGPTTAVGPGIYPVLPAASNTFCGIFLRKHQSGDLIPMARSYHGGDWEAAPGPLACPAEDVSATSVTLRPPQDAGDEYVLLAKDGTMDGRRQIARFLEMTTFGATMSEIDALDDGGWGDVARAQHVRSQMDLPATSHRAHFRRRSNTKWDAPLQPARSDHPCSPNSRWRKYAYTRHDVFATNNDEEETEISFEVVLEEAGLVATIHEADRSSDVSGSGSGEFDNKFDGHSGRGYFEFDDVAGDFIEWTVDVASGGTYPVSFRYLNGENDHNGNRALELWVNDFLEVPAVDFLFTGLRYQEQWKYSAMFDVVLNPGQNRIKLVASNNPGPFIDHLRIGKPPAILIKTNGYPRTIARNGIQFLSEWGYDFANKVGTFDKSPEAPQGHVFAHELGRVKVKIGRKTDYLDIGNPIIDFAGYEQYLPPNVFYFAPSDDFQETGSDLSGWPIKKGQELLLTNGFSGPVCDSVPPFAEAHEDAPIIGELPSGEWVIWTPTIQFEDNGPLISDEDRTVNVLSDGGGGLVIQTSDQLKCSNVKRSFANEDTCFLSTESTACSASQPAGEVLIPMNKANVVKFNNLAGKYVYAIRGLPMEDIGDHPCRKSKSRWEVKLGTPCLAPTQLQSATISALTDAISSSKDSNEFIRDVKRTLSCASSDETLDKIDIEIAVNGNCYVHVHPSHFNVYDFSLWTVNHPGGAYNIQKWVQGHQGAEGWHLDFNPNHPVTFWEANAAEPNIVYVARLGDNIAFRDLTNELKTDAIAQHFGATPQPVSGGGIIVCGSVGEVANDPSLPESFDVRSELKDPDTDGMFFDNQKQVVWTEVALTAPDQLRQRIAWALGQILTIVPGNIDAAELTEVFLYYHDSLVKHAFGNYRSLLAEISHSPLMGEHLSFVDSKSHSYVYKNENKRISRADENFAREVMQLFSIGLYELNDDGTPVMNPTTGAPLETYSNDDIESLARAWTGFVMTGARSNYETDHTGTSSNHLDPMYIEPDYRDPFPKTDLSGGFIGDRYLLCTDLPAQSFLKTGARYRLLGGSSLPELMKDPAYFGQESGILKLELDPESPLYQRLYNGGNYELNVELDSDLPCSLGFVECEVDTLRVVKIGSIYYEFVERPCVQFPFYDNGKQIQLRDNFRNGQMCANPDLTQAREACCREGINDEVRFAVIEPTVTHKYDGERMTWATAQNRCIAYGRDLCLYAKVIIVGTNDDDDKKGYHWTNQNCGINMKVNPEGHVAIVHDAVSSNVDTIPWHVEEVNSLNWFRVYWNGGSYPGDSESNTCEDNHCKSMPDGSCLCKTKVSESTVFTNMNVSKEDVMSQLFVGAVGPKAGSTAYDIGNGVKVHVLGSVDANTIFEVEDRGRTLYLKNTLSTVSIEGWTLVPQIYEAEDALINNAPIMASESATGGSFVDTSESDQTGYVQWNVDVPSSGKYLISLRYANNDNPRPLSVFVNTQEIERTPTNPNNPIPLDYLGRSPTDYYPLSRCQGDCNNDGHCQPGLICMERTGSEEIYGCNGSDTAGNDYCVDVTDFPSGFLNYPSGGWTDDWRYTEPLEVNLNAGDNTIRVQVTSDMGPNIDHLKIEGLPASSSPSSFRNPPHFMSLITDVFGGGSPGGLGEQTLRDAQYESDAVLDEYFYHNNMAPYLCTRVMQRFSFSNPSPRFVTSCVDAFRRGMFVSGGETFGSGEYGSLEAMAASILLDKEATNGAVASDPSYGAMREPILKVSNLMRSMAYQTAIPTTLGGAPMQTTHNIKLWRIHEKIGQGPFDFPSVFSFFLSEYIPDSGRALTAKLTSPETSLVNMANNVGLLNGMFSLIKYGLGDCNGGFSTYDVDTRLLPSCNDDGLFQRSYGHLFYQPSGATDLDKAADLALLLTAGRLNDDNLNKIVDACSLEPDHPSKTQCMQQLIVTTGEFHSTNLITQNGQERTTSSSGGSSTVPYKALVYFFLDGGVDSHNMLAPHTCAPIDVYGRYKDIRGNVGLGLNETLEIQANNGAQPCESFGIHQNLTVLKLLYDQGHVNFVANAGLLAKPVNSDDYKEQTPVSLFAHNAMKEETKGNDISDEFSGTGVGGRIADVLSQMGIPTETFSINGQELTLTGEAGQGPGQSVISSSGVPVFNANPSISNMNDVIKSINNVTTSDSGFYADTWSQKLSESMARNDLLKQEIDAAVLNATFPSSEIGSQFEMVARIMATREARGSLRDIFYVSDRGYDNHKNLDSLPDKFISVNDAMATFVSELKFMGAWESTAIVQFSEFARTLNPNGGGGTDHAWGGNHFIVGGSVKGGKVLGKYPSDFREGDADKIAMSRGRIIPTFPWDAMWKGTAEWLGIPASGPEMDKILPMHTNFPPSSLFREADLFH